MRDFEAFKRRFFTAIGLLSASVVPACETSTATGSTPLADSSTTATDAGADTVNSDGSDAADAADAADASDGLDGADEVDAADAADAADGNIEDVGAPDSGSDGIPDPLDVGAPDTSGGTDISRAADVPDAQSDDVPTPDDVPGPIDAGPAPDAGSEVQNLCEFGTAEYVCYTATELQNNIDNPPMGGKPGDPKYAGLLPPEGCPEPALVQDGCCNAAVGEAVLEGNTCCYNHCAGACCGRPLEVAGHSVVAATRQRADWLEGDLEPVTGLDSQARTTLAAVWRADARDEHASVASFQRFGLDLMSLGAPPELIADCAQATLDEIGHARIAFGVAARLDGQDLGPDRLDLSGLQVRGDLVSAATAAAREGCVGETLAAVCVGAAARLCTDPSLAASLTRIASDEARHAELAWRFVAWAVREGGQPVRVAVAEAFRQAVLAGPGHDPRDAALANVPDSVRVRFGRLPGNDAAHLRARALTEIVAPSAAALLA